MRGFALSAHRRRTTVAALFAAALVAGGCGSGAGDQGGDVKAVDINPVPREDLRQGGTLRYAVEELPEQWNGNHLDGPNLATSTVLSATSGGTEIDTGAKLSSPLTPAATT